MGSHNVTLLFYLRTTRPSMSGDVQVQESMTVAAANAPTGSSEKGPRQKRERGAWKANGELLTFFFFFFSFLMQQIRTTDDTT